MIWDRGQIRSLLWGGSSGIGFIDSEQDARAATSSFHANKPAATLMPVRAPIGLASFGGRKEGRHTPCAGFRTWACADYLAERNCRTRRSAGVKYFSESPHLLAMTGGGPRRGSAVEPAALRRSDHRGRCRSGRAAGRQAGGWRVGPLGVEWRQPCTKAAIA